MIAAAEIVGILGFYSCFFFSFSSTKKKLFSVFFFIKLH